VKPKDPDSDVELISESEDGSDLIVRFFGEREFTILTDVNYWLLLSSFDPRNMGGMVRLVQSLLAVNPEEGEDPEMAAFRVGRDFNEFMASRKGLTLERVVRLVTDLTAMAGNAQPESSNA
jgi:hypothetical protein